MEPLLVRLRKHWWVVALRGALALLLAVVAFARPFATIVGLMWVVGAYFFVDGIVAATAGVRAMRANQQWGWLAFEGILGVCAGILTFVMPGVTAFVFVGITVIWAVVTGAMMVLGAVRLRNEIENEWTVGLAGIASVVLGLALAAYPAAGLVAWSWMLGVYALVAGVLLLSFASRLRGMPIPEVTETESFDVPLPSACDPATVRASVVGQVVRIIVPRGMTPSSGGLK